VTPTDDIQIWLHCANIWDKAYTTLEEVLADTDTLLALITSNNAVDYMIRSTTWATQITVPKMTSDTTPSGECFCTSVHSSYRPYKAFDGDNTTRANMGSGDFSSSTPSWIGYKFDSPVTLSRAYVYQTSYTYNGCYIQSSSDGVTYTNISEPFTLGKNGQEIVFPATTDTYFRLYVGSVQEGAATARPIYTIQFYSDSVPTSATAMTYIGQNNYCANTLLRDATWCNAICNSTYFESVLNVKSPDMTGATTPSGEVTASSYISSYYPYLTFDGAIRSAWATGWGGRYSTGSWIKYKFPEEVTIYALKYYHRNSDGSTAYPVNIEGSNDDSNFNLVKTFTETIDNAYHTVVFDTPSSYEWYRWYNTGETVSNLDEVKYYGRKDV
jgi:hypothetical protein